MLFVTIDFFFQENKEYSDDYDTVLLATGRKPLTEQIRAMDVGVKLHPQSKKVLAESEQTSLSHVFAVGDVLEVRSQNIMQLWKPLMGKNRNF